MPDAPKHIVFDIGGVLIDWNPRYLYRRLFDDEDAMEHFLTHVCSHTWNLLQDAGRSFDDAVAELSARYPEHAEMIRLYHERWEDMLPGAIDGSVAILNELHRRQTSLYAITNFSTEKFAITRQRFDFLALFRDIAVSAELRLLKPDPAIYLRLCLDNNLDPADCVFIDDAPANVAGAENVGMRAVHFRSPTQLRRDLDALGVL